MTRTKKAAATKPHAVTLQEMAGGAISIADLRPDELVDIDAVIEHPENTRVGDVSAIVESIQQHGIYRRLIVQRQTPTGEQRMRVIAGNHTRRAAKQLGYVKLPMEFIDCTDAKARKILLVDNRANDLAHYDERGLLESLLAMQAEDDLLGTGYSADDLEDLRTKLSVPDFDALAAAHADESDGVNDGLVAVRLRVTPECATRFDATLARMAGETDTERLTALLDAVP